MPDDYKDAEILIGNYENVLKTDDKNIISKSISSSSLSNKGVMRHGLWHTSRIYLFNTKW